MRILNLIIFISLCPICLLFADTEKDRIIEELTRIHAIENSEEKLSAYDNLAIKYGAKGETKIKSETDKGEWQLTEKISPIDDSKIVIAYVYSENRKSILKFQLYKGKFSAAIAAEYSYFGISGETHLVTTRMDKNKATKSYWTIGESGKVLWHDKPKSLAEVLTKTSKMLLEAREYGKGDVIFSYDVRGFDKIIDKLK